jgi:two-component system nitrogen regulation response regulator GlnG
VSDFAAPTLSSNTLQTRNGADANRRGVPAMTIIAHPDWRRVGEISLLLQPSTSVTRSSPAFFPPGEPARATPLATDWVSSREVTLGIEILAGGALRLIPRVPKVSVNGIALQAPTVIDWPQLAAGVSLTLGSRVAICLHTVAYPMHRGPKMDFVGESDAMEEIRRSIRRLADADEPVLIRGESGSGKELVARALFKTGRRAAGPFVPLNMAELGSTAAADLFGHEKGAFTGAIAERAGYFMQAHGGTIFLDEIGFAPDDVQKMLLRVFEHGEVRPIGAKSSKRVDVRILAATDSALEAEVEARCFSGPLFTRLAVYPLWIPPLRERRQDIAVLFHHFLADRLRAFGAEARLDQSDKEKRAWLSAEDVAHLVGLDWPFNIRALQNVAKQVAIDYHNAPHADVRHILARAGGSVVAASSLVPVPIEAVAASPPPAVKERLRPADLKPDDIEEALQDHGSVPAAAVALGINKQSLYNLIRKHNIKTAVTIPREEFEAVVMQLAGDADAIARHLGVHRRSVQLRIAQLGLKASKSG